MNQFLRPSAVGLVVLALTGCSSSDDDKGAKGGGAGMTGAQSTCTSPTLQVLFAPMYSAHDGQHTFQVPAVVNDVPAAGVTWSASDTSAVTLAKTTQGVMITTKKAGEVNIIATSGSACGVSKLTITAATPQEWDLGRQRYTGGTVFGPPPDAMPAGPPDGGVGDGGPPPEIMMAACTNCHGDTATMGPLKTVSHTPQQTGGFSDTELIDVFTKGVLPPNAKYDESIGLPQNAWQAIHKWNMTAQEAKGMVVYLRSLTPAPQTGKADADFFGRFRQNDAGAPPSP